MLENLMIGKMFEVAVVRKRGDELTNLPEYSCAAAISTSSVNVKSRARNSGPIGG